MSKDQGSRNVSLGPYRSTKLALEERLTKQEAKKIAKSVSKLQYNSSEDFVSHANSINEMLLGIGYSPETKNLYIKSGSGQSSYDFVYFSKGKSKGNSAILFSGSSNSLETVIADIDVIDNIASFNHARGHGSIFHNTITHLWALCAYAIFVGSALLFENYGIFGTFMSIPIAPLTFLLGASALDGTYRNGLLKRMSLLSKDSASYAFSTEAYIKLGNKNNPEKLESSEIKQLPEKKSLLEETPEVSKYGGSNGKQ